MLSAIISSFLTVSGVAILALIAKKRAERRILTVLRSYFEPADENTPSQFSQVTDAISKQFASAMMSNLKMTELGVKRGEQRQEQAVNAALMEDVTVMQSPMLGALLQQFPKLSKLAGKNPQLAGMALGKLQEVMSKSRNNNSGTAEKYDDYSALFNQNNGGF